MILSKRLCGCFLLFQPWFLVCPLISLHFYQFSSCTSIQIHKTPPVKSTNPTQCLDDHAKQHRDMTVTGSYIIRSHVSSWVWSWHGKLVLLGRQWMRDSECESVCACLQMMTLDLVAAEERGHIQTIENNAARYHVTSHLDPSQQLASLKLP